MSYAVAQSDYRDIDGILWGWRWSPNQPDGHTQLTYSFPTSTAAYGGYTGIDGFEAFNAGQKAAAVKILAMFDDVCNVDFVFTADSSSANIRMAEADAVNVGTGPVAIPTALGIAPDPNYGPLFSQGDTWFNHSLYNSPVLGDFAFASGLMHEIGHALGLKHGHLPQEVKDANGNILYTNPALAPDHDSLEYSVMTYRAYPGAPTDTIDAAEYPSTLMQNDILALQYLYGPNYDYNSGNTVYKWDPLSGECFVNGKGKGVPLHHKIFMTIWDGGGFDTYDFSNYATDARINLAPGGWSTPSKAQRADLDSVHPNTHLARGCIANAQVFSGDFHGYIENAHGGMGDDTILGNIVNNALSGGIGDDIIRGFAGLDTLFGGLGKDRLYGGSGIDGLGGGSGNDYLEGGGSSDYLDGGQGADRLCGNAGNDILVGGEGRDWLNGGSGNDTFDFNSILDTGITPIDQDVIVGFNGVAADTIDLSDIDANRSADGNQHFSFIGSQPFTELGQVRVYNDGVSTFVALNAGGSNSADAVIRLSGIVTLDADDFIL